MTLYQIHSRTITAGELLERSGDPDLTVVDVRSTDACNGWRLGSVRGGHIPGAVAFPTTWLTTEDDAEIRRQFAAKGIAPGQNVVLYGGGPGDTDLLESRLIELGLESVRVCEAGWPEWSSVDPLPAERLPNHDRLVHPAWLAEVLDDRRPEAPPRERSLLFHVDFGVPGEHAEDHLPGALYLDMNRLEDPADWNRYCNVDNTMRAYPEIAANWAEAGITGDKWVAFYCGTGWRASETWFYAYPQGWDGIAVYDGGCIVKYDVAIETSSVRSEPCMSPSSTACTCSAGKDPGWCSPRRISQSGTARCG